MTIKELIEKLSKFDPKSEVKIEGVDPADWRYINDIHDIEVITLNDDMYNEEDYDENGNVLESSKVVIINGGDF
jgi:hypothetical protein